MKKTIGGTASPAKAAHSWLDVEAIASVEATSEDAVHPVEDALTGVGAGWRASVAGEQRLAVQFYEPLDVRRVRLVFEERTFARTQEFTLEWLGRDGGPARSLLRQQFTFAPPGTTVEREDYDTEVGGVHGLRLTIVPDINDAAATATVKEWRIEAVGDRSTSRLAGQRGTGAGAAGPDAGVAERFQAWRLRGAAHDRAMETRALRSFAALALGTAIALAYTFR